MPPPPFDEVLKALLRPLWLDLHSSRSLDCAHSLAALVLESVIIANDHVEKKAYGLHAAGGTKTAWENLCRMLRVALVVAARNLAGLNDLSVRFISSSSSSSSLSSSANAATAAAQATAAAAGAAPAAGGSAVAQWTHAAHGTKGIFRILAEDTLSFAVSADHAAAHEQRCSGIVNKRSGATNVSPAPALDPSSASALQAWGTQSDRRWRDLIQLCEGDDAADAASASAYFPGSSPSRAQLSAAGPNSSSNGNNNGSSSNRPAAKKRRPLLLLFPHHVSCSDALAAYRVWALA